MTLQRFCEALVIAPVVPVLHGITPAEADNVGDALIQAGIGVLEVTLDSPTPLKPLSRLKECFGDNCVLAAGTLRDAREVKDAKRARAVIVDSPNSPKRSLPLARLQGWSAFQG